jgi:cold shock CspA family protein
MPQGTVKQFDTTTLTGSVLLDDAQELPIDRQAFGAAGLLELRLGQRVRFEVTDGRLHDLTIVSL